MSDKITLAELRAAAGADSPARTRLTYLFDEGRFTELDACANDQGEPVGVITAFGYVDGEPVYAFSQNIQVKKGALTKAAADKIAKVYDLAAKTGVQIVGIYDSYGADVSQPAEALKGYGELMMRTNRLSGVVPQIAVVAGVCAGASAMLAVSADLVIMTKEAALYVAPNSQSKGSAETAAANGTAAILAEDDQSAMEAVKKVLLRLPANNLSPVPVFEYDAPNGSPEGEADTFAAGIADADSLIELSADFGTAAYTALGAINGSTVGFAATNKTDSRLTAEDCSKLARFVRFCDSFSIPLVTLVDTEGFEADDLTETSGAVKAMSMVAHAYAEATTPKVSIVIGKAYGPAYIALAGKGSNADITIALPGAVITPLAPVTAVEFLQHDELSGADDLTAARNALADQFARESLVNAAANGCIDFITEAYDLRQQVADSLDMLSGKREAALPKKHGNIQL